MGFTGIIREVGTIWRVEQREGVKLWDGSLGRVLTIAIRSTKVLRTGTSSSNGTLSTNGTSSTNGDDMRMTKMGDSIAVNGVCLTVTSIIEQRNVFTVDVAAHTAELTTFKDFEDHSFLDSKGKPHKVNLEAAVRVGVSFTSEDLLLLP